MPSTQTDSPRPRSMAWENLTLAQYVQLRNGVPLGHPASLRNMLHRSFGAASFAAFWQYWNPIWGYGLGRFIYTPLRYRMPAPAAFGLTFVASGIIHDLATTAARGSLAFLFTPWFCLLSVGAITGRALDINLKNRPWWIRAGVNLSYLVTCLALTLIFKWAVDI